MRFERVHIMVRRLMRVQQERGAVLDIAVAVLCVSSRFSATARKCVATSKNLRDTQFYVSEQFPPEVAAKRRRLFRKVKEEKLAGRKAWVSYDTLLVDGKPVRDAKDGPDGLRYLLVVWNCNGLSASKREDQNFVSLFLQLFLLHLGHVKLVKLISRDITVIISIANTGTGMQNVIAVE